MNKALLLYIALVLIIPFQLFARDPQFNAQNLKPATDVGYYLGVFGSEVVAPGKFSLGLTSDYAHAPIGFFNAAGTKIQNIVEREVGFHLSGTYGFLDWLDAGLLVSSAPYLVFRPTDNAATAADESATTETRIRMSDLLLNARLRLLDNRKDPIGLGIVPFVTIPTGSGVSFVGNNQFTGGGMLIVETPRIADRFSVALNTGYEIRQRATLSTGTIINDLFLYGLGGNFSAHPKVDLIAELRGFTTVSDFFGSQRPLEWEGGVRFYPVEQWAVTVGGGTGLVEGIGNPAVRILAGVAYVPKREPYKPKEKVTEEPERVEEPKVEEPKIEEPKKEKKKKERLTREQKKDTDGDGIRNKDDLCPTEFGPADNGGCPVRPKIVINPEEYRILTRPIHFDFEKTRLRKDLLPILDTMVETLKAKPSIRLLSIEGHTDEVGRTKFNQWLSEERAKRVLDYLVSHGIEPERLTSIGFGETKPIDSAHKATAWKKNRRVEFVFKEVDGLVVPEETPPISQPTLPESGPVTVPPVEATPPEIPPQPVPEGTVPPMPPSGL